MIFSKAIKIVAQVLVLVVLGNQLAFCGTLKAAAYQKTEYSEMSSMRQHTSEQNTIREKNKACQDTTKCLKWEQSDASAVLTRLKMDTGVTMSKQKTFLGNIPESGLAIPAEEKVAGRSTVPPDRPDTAEKQFSQVRLI